MAVGTRLNSVLLTFDENASVVRADISAIAYDPDGNLWLGSDELATIERLSPMPSDSSCHTDSLNAAASAYGNHQQFKVGDYIDLADSDGEIDIEGMDISDGYLWLTGSHSTKRKGVKRNDAQGNGQKDTEQDAQKEAQKNIQRLLDIGTDVNRYVLACIPLVDGTPVKQDERTGRRAARLEPWRDRKGVAPTNRNTLIKALLKDDHIGPFLQMGLPSKDNGFDIEALAAQGNRLFLGLRGPVLRGMAMIVEIELQVDSPGVLSLKKPENTKALENEKGSKNQERSRSNSDNNKRYRKHFVDLNGLGIRDLCFQGEDLLILAGPTMQLTSTMQVFRFENALTPSDGNLDTLRSQASGGLTKLFDLPSGPHSTGNAEGIALVPNMVVLNSEPLPSQQSSSMAQPVAALMVVYDSPAPERLSGESAIFADIFQL